MPELRWTLLIIGAVFIVVLALWEFRRQRQVPRQGANPRTPASSDRVAPTLDVGGDGPRVHREPTITLPELHPDPSIEARAEPRFTPRTREPAKDLPVVEVDDASFSRLKVEGETGTPEEEVVEDIPAEAAHDADTMAISTLEPERPTGFVSDNDAPQVHEEPAPEPQPEHHSVGATAAGEPVVEWPGESSRKIVALRLVSHPASRFQGRAVRQALAAEGFVLGKFDIFHKAGPDDRAVLSAASLTKPGTFALNTIDAQRFGGISLFAVLPGPLPPQQTFDELLTTARSLNDRLQGALQDERGEPLTPTRSASIRQSLSESAPQPETRQ